MEEYERCLFCGSCNIKEVKDDLIFCGDCKSYFRSYLPDRDEDEQDHLKIADAII